MSAPLPVSTIECIASESIAELPEIVAAINFDSAMSRLPAIAAMTAFLDSLATCESLQISGALRCAMRAPSRYEELHLEQAAPSVIMFAISRRRHAEIERTSTAT